MQLPKAMWRAQLPLGLVLFLVHGVAVLLLINTVRSISLRTVVRLVQILRLTEKLERVYLASIHTCPSETMPKRAMSTTVQYLNINSAWNLVGLPDDRRIELTVSHRGDLRLLIIIRTALELVYYINIRRIFCL